MTEASILSPVKIDDLSVRELIDFRADSSPDTVFLVDPETGETLSYSQLREQVQRVTINIAAHGIKPGETVAYAVTNGLSSATCILGIIYGGYIATAINLVAGNDTIAYVLGHSACRLVVVQPNTLEQVEKSLESNLGSSEIMMSDDCLMDLDVSFINKFSPTSSTNDGLLMYTSGTTGRPKGVVLRQSNLVAGGLNTARAHKLSAADRVLCVLPLYHINGLCVTIFGALVSGGSVVLPAKFSVSLFWQAIRDHYCTWFSVVPTQISYLLHNAEENPDVAKNISGLRFGRSASAPLSPDVHEAFETKFGVPIIETMGLTETAAQILSNPMPPGKRKIGSPGIAVGNEVIIADDQQQEIARGLEGEVLVRGSNVLREYLNNEEATNASLMSDGWLRTGDLGRMDEEGYVFITGRLKELIIKGGENIAPREIDEALYTHPDVIEAAGFACACKRYGQRIEASVVVAVGSSVSEQDLITLCKIKIGQFKSPDRVHFMNELPKGPSGKIQRIKLQERFSVLQK